MDYFRFDSSEVVGAGFGVIVTPQDARRQFRISVAMLLSLGLGAVIAFAAAPFSMATSPSFFDAASRGAAVKASAIDARSLYTRNARAIAQGNEDQQPRSRVN